MKNKYPSSVGWVVTQPTDFWPNHKVVIKDQDGMEPPMTKKGRSARAVFSPAGDRDKNIPDAVGAGATRNLGCKIDVAEQFHWKRGRYELQVLYHDEQEPTPLRVKSDWVAFEVD